MVESVLAFVLSRLSIFLLHQCTDHLGGGIEREIQFIKDELGSMRAFLRDAEANEDDIPELQEWVRQVREVAYKTEDVLDEFLMRFALNHADGIYGHIRKINSSIKNLRARREISSKIKNIRSRIEDISARHHRYQPIHASSESATTPENIVYDLRGNALLVEEAKLVGIQEPKRELISQVLTGDSGQKIISVLGMGGLGKTTLVKRVYEDANVKRQFKSHAWLTVSETLHVKFILNDLIQQLYNEIHEQVPQHLECIDGDKLRAFVKDFLQDRKYIIVLDDVWKMDTWDAIKYAFPDDNCGSCIILTTRIADTAYGSCIQSHDYVHKMKPLSDEESWTLFCDKTFGDNCCPPYLEDVSSRILSKCKGLPLAIVSIGGVLALKDKSKLDEWEMIHRNLGSELDGTGKLEIVKKILLLGYNDLPFFLKSCLLHTSIYPEDWGISVDILIQQWIAEGFIQEKEGITTSEVARGYLHELVNRSLIQVERLHVHGNIRNCRIHDILREIILSKSREQNLTAVAVTNQHSRLQDNIRSLAIHQFIENLQAECNRFKHLRSLIIFGYADPISTSSLSKLLHGGPKLLKVLDLRGAQQLKNIPKEVFKLFHLKYLSLRDTGVEIIPQSISKLQNLEYLNLIDTNVTELPIGILKLKKIRELLIFHLGSYSENFSYRGFKAPCGIGSLLSLQNLYSVDACNGETVIEIGKLTQLRKLSISKLRREDGENLCSSLRKLKNLLELRIVSIEEDEILDLQHPISQTARVLQVLELGGRLEKVPQWVPSLQGIIKLIFHETRLREDPLESLQHLPNLAKLVLSNAYDGEMLHFKDGGFQKLKKLELQKLNFKWMSLESGTMPCLQKLILADCKSLCELPMGIQYLNKLQFLGFYHMVDELISKLQDRGIDLYRKNAQISDIAIGNWVNGKWEKRYL